MTLELKWSVLKVSTAKHPQVFNFLCLAVDTFRNDTSGYTPELKWSATAKTGRQSLYNTYRYYLRWSVLKVSTAQGIIIVPCLELNGYPSRVHNQRWLMRVGARRQSFR